PQRTRRVSRRDGQHGGRLAAPTAGARHPSPADADALGEGLRARRCRRRARGRDKGEQLHDYVLHGRAAFGGNGLAGSPALPHITAFYIFDANQLWEPSILTVRWQFRWSLSWMIGRSPDSPP